MKKERSLTEQSVLKVICTTLSKEYLSEVLEEDIIRLTKLIECGDISIDALRSLAETELVDYINGQLRLF